MQGILTANDDLRSMFDAAKRFAAKFGRCGLAEPDDIAQKAMLRLLAKADKRPATVGWLYRVVRSIAYDAGREHAREARYRTDFQDGFAGSVCEIADQTGNVYLNGRHGSMPEVDDVDLIPRLNRTLKQLSPALRQVLMLYADGCSYDQIAEQTEVSINTVRSRLHHARRKARSLLNDLN